VSCLEDGLLVKGVRREVFKKEEVDIKTKQPPGKVPEWLELFGGAEQDRTVDLLTASQALSQLSYSPTFKRTFYLPDQIFTVNSFLLKRCLEPLVLDE
jgi:hypothetical protein